MEHDILTKLHACRGGVLFASRYPSIREAWDACERSDWLLWYAGRRLTGEDHRRTFVRIAIDCARLVLPLFERYRPGDRRVRDCLDVTQRWIDGTATLGDVKAAYAAYASDFAEGIDSKFCKIIRKYIPVCP